MNIHASDLKNNQKIVETQNDTSKRSGMVSYKRHVGALLRRNWLYRKRTWISSIIQLLLPAAMVMILVSIRIALKDDKTFKPTLIEAVYPDKSITPFSFLDYITAVQTPRTCIKKPDEIARQDVELKQFKFLFRTLTISDINPFDWPVPFLKCDARKCKVEGEDATDFCEVNLLAIAPMDTTDSSFAQSFEAWILDTYPLLDSGHSFIQPFSSPTDIDEYVTSANYGLPGYPKIALAVIIGGSGKDYEYTIRTNSTNFNSPDIAQRPGQWTSPSTKKKFRSLARQAEGVCDLEGGTTHLGAYNTYCTAQYMYNGALVIQRLVDDWILFHTGTDVQIAENGVSFVDFPSREYTRDGFYATINPYAPLLLILGFLYPISYIIRSVVLEKELRQKELMKMMSVSESELEFSWFVSFSLFFVLVSIFTTIASSFLYTKASPVLLLVFWLFSSIAAVLFCLTISACFSKSTRATLVGILLFFAGYFLTLSASYDTGSRGLISLLCIHPVSSLTYGIQIVGILEDSGIGIQRSNLNFSDSVSELTFSNILGFLVFDSIFWGFLMWYLNRVIPGDYGQSLPINFFCKSTYWCRPQSNSITITGLNAGEYHVGVPIEPVGPVYKDQEAEGIGVHIRGLTKKFGEKTAVNNLDLSMYEGQVFALLGHNGAGKTTLISMLTGMLGVTSGEAVIYKKSIRTQMTEIRENIGVCLQHDCLFPQLTVKEHIQFFARIKGLYQMKSFDEAESSVNESIKDVALYEKRNTYSKDLSGGMKRKLSLAIAFCGDSKIIFLDEPTSGMDPFSRRFTWNVIRENRSDRCIVLTTHFMDEADILGDRIAILSQGHLRCVGSSLFLKKEYGVGYQVTIEKNQSNSVIVSGLIDSVRSIVPEASLFTNIKSEMTFQLPIRSSERFPSLFNFLESQVDAGTINAYGVSITTMDEVFLCVARGENHSAITLPSASTMSIMNQGESPERSANLDSINASADLTESELFRIHVRALFEKRALNFKRDKKAWICSTILPILFSLFGFITVTLIIPSKNMGKLELRLSDYNPTHVGKRKRYPFPVGNSSLFSCQPSSCISDYLQYNISCGNLVSLNSTASLCTNPGLIGFEDVLTSTGQYPMNQNVSSVLDVSEILFQNYDTFALGSITQYGAVFFTHGLNSVIENTSESYDDFVGDICTGNAPDEILSSFPELCSRFFGQGYVVATNFTAPHASLLYQGLVDETIIRVSKNDDAYSIKVNIHPMPVTKLENDFADAESSFSAWFYLVLSFPFISGTFATFIVTERMSKAKHLQTVAGVKPGAYWLSTFLWDMLNYQFPLWGVLILMYSFGVDAFTTSDRQVNAGTIVLLLLYGPASAGFSYMMTFLFISPSACNMFLIVFNFFIGLAGALTCLILRFIHIGQVLDQNPGNLKTIAVSIEWILRFVPSFSFAKGLLFCINIEAFALLNGASDLTVWNSDILGLEILFLSLQSVIYPCLAVYFDIHSTKPSFLKCFTKENVHTEIEGAEAIDEDIITEADRVVNGNASDDVIVIKELSKQYPNGKVAVNNFSLGIPKGQCFGLLGINGAGKTTIMGILTAEFSPTSGDAVLAGNSVSLHPELTRRMVGYCPQFDAHFTNMTGREHVELYAAIKGIPKNTIREAAASKLTDVGISEEDRDRLSSEYSGGMKRKLSVACAMIGDPPIMFLDEPSTGMDPVSRRDLWTVISKMVVNEEAPSHQTSVVLTTHSMEECEALCPRIGIMAEGSLKCLGSAQHLKTRFGQGFQVEVKIDEPDDNHADVIEILEKAVVYQSTSVSGNLVAKKTPTTDMALSNDIYFNLDQSKAFADQICGDGFLSNKISVNDLVGSIIYKHATSDIGIELSELAAFYATELRLKKLVEFFQTAYPKSIIREQQGSRIRFEVPSEGVKIADLFTMIEDNKVSLQIDDYGISQTTLEQVFNMHAAAAEARKEGLDDH